MNVSTGPLTVPFPASGSPMPPTRLAAQVGCEEGGGTRGMEGGRGGREGERGRKGGGGGGGGGGEE